MLPVADVLVRLDRYSRRLSGTKLRPIRRGARHALEVLLGERVEGRAHGLVLRGAVQHRRYLSRLTSGTIEPFTAELWQAAVVPGSTVVDVGAFLGYYALAAAQRVGKHGRVLAVEASPETFVRLAANVARNNLPVLALNAALSDHIGYARFFVGAGNGSTSGMGSTHAAGTWTTTCSTTLDVLCSEPDVVKIDVEGFETAVLSGMAGILASGRPMTIFIEVNFAALAEAGSSPDDLLGVLQQHGFTLSVIDEDLRTLRDLSTLAPDLSYFNILARR